MHSLIIARSKQADRAETGRTFFPPPTQLFRYHDSTQLLRNLPIAAPFSPPTWYIHCLCRQYWSMLRSISLERRTPPSSSPSPPRRPSRSLCTCRSRSYSAWTWKVKAPLRGSRVIAPPPPSLPPSPMAPPEEELPPALLLDSSRSVGWWGACAGGRGGSSMPPTSPPPHPSREGPALLTLLSRHRRSYVANN